MNHPATDELLAGVDLAGRRYLVTGSSGGLGLETVRALAAVGAHVVMAARNDDKNTEAAALIRAQHPAAQLEPLTVDLGVLASVRAAAASLLGGGLPLHGIVANAGVMATPEGRTVDGFETQFGVDHLGHFLLVRELLPLLEAGAPSRVVIVSSAGHRMGDLDLADVNFERRAYEPFVAYGAAKTANVLHAVELDRRLRDRGVRAFAVHPGGIGTELARYMTPDVRKQMMSMIAAQGADTFRWKTVEEGAATQVWALVSPDLDGEGGRYCEDCSLSDVVPDHTDLGVNDPGVLARAVDVDRARALWELSEQLVDAAETPLGRRGH